MNNTLLLRDPSSILASIKLLVRWNSENSLPGIEESMTDTVKANYFIESTDVTPLSGNWQKLLVKKNLNETLLKSFLKLPNDWNGNGALPISEQVVLKSISLLRTLDHQPDIFPTARNSVQFEYESDDNYLEIEIFNSSINILKQINNKETEYQTNDFNKIKEEILDYHASIRSK